MKIFVFLQISNLFQIPATYICTRKHHQSISLPFTLWEAALGGRFKARNCSRLIAGIACSNPAEGMAACLLCLLYVVWVAASATSWSLIQKSSTVCVCVCVQARTCAHSPSLPLPPLSLSFCLI